MMFLAAGERKTAFEDEPVRELANRDVEGTVEIIGDETIAGTK